MQFVEVTSVPGRRVAWKLRPKIIVDISVALINNALPGIDIFYQHDFSHSNMQRACLFRNWPKMVFIRLHDLGTALGSVSVLDFFGYLSSSNTG